MNKKFLLSSQIFTDKQLIESNLLSGLFTSENAFNDIFNVKVKKENYSCDLLK